MVPKPSHATKCCWQCCGSGSGFGFSGVPGSQIWIQEGKNDLQKLKKINKFQFLVCWMFSFEGGRFPLKLGCSLWRPRDKIIAIFDQTKYLKNFSCIVFNFGHRNHGSGSISGSVFTWNARSGSSIELIIGDQPLSMLIHVHCSGTIRQKSAAKQACLIPKHYF